MRVTRTREHTVNMGNYESLKIGASVEIDSENQEAKGLVEPGQELHEFLDMALDTLLEDELKEARELTNTKDSYILSYRSSNA